MSNNSKLSRKEKRQLRLQKMHAKYKLTIRDTKTFAEVFSLRLSLSNVLLFITTCAVILIFVVYLVIAYTPLKEYVIPNYPELEEREKIERNAELVDSLEYEMKLYAQKMQILQTILNGEDPSAYELLDSIVVTNENYANLNFDLSPADSMLRMEIQENEALNVNFHANTAGVRIENLFFYPPINGIVS
ncbi:MAG: hypothetical protein J5588_05780, partial [Bacteroidales bacterium]|nr:hypothetical protein [Bacteroidales bacterium]